MNQEILNEILNGGLKHDISRERFVWLIQKHTYLRSVDIYDGIYRLVSQKKSISERQLGFIKAVVSQWSRSDFNEFIDTLNRYPFLKDTQPIFQQIVDGVLLAKPAWDALDAFNRACRSSNAVFKYFDEEPCHPMNGKVFLALVEHRWLKGEQNFDEIPSSKIRELVREHQKTLSRFVRMKAADKADVAFVESVKVLVKKGVPLTRLQFERIQTIVSASTDRRVYGNCKMGTRSI